MDGRISLVIPSSLNASAEFTRTDGSTRRRDITQFSGVITISGF